MGCLRAAKETEIVKVSLERLPPELDGIMFIATNEHIKVGIEGRKDVFTELNLGGNYVLNKDELALLIKNSRKLKEIEDAQTIEDVKKILKSK